MSQVKFKSTYEGRPVVVMGGWDRPLRHFHLCVFDADPEGETEVVWSGLDHWDGGGASATDPMRRQITEMGISVPDGFWERCERREGNVLHEFVDGEWSRFDL